MKIYFIDKPYYGKGEFQYPDGTYNNREIVVKTMSKITADNFTNYLKECNPSEVFIYEYTYKNTKLYQGPNLPTRMSLNELWVRFDLKK